MFPIPDFNQAPLLVIWEVTRGCALACRHCRANAVDDRDPRELSTEEGEHLLDEIKAMGTPLVVFTGGDPLRRDDLEDLIAHGRSIGLRVAAIPATTPRLTKARVASLQAAGLNQMAISLDGATAERHDGFRRVDGCFAKAVEAAEWAHQVGLPLQVNTVFAGWNAAEFDAIAALVDKLEVVFWEVFFLVPTGRGTELQSCTPAEYQRLFEQLHAHAKKVKYVVKVTEAPHYRVHALLNGGGGVAAHGAHHGSRPAAGHPGGRPASAGQPGGRPMAALASGGPPANAVRGMNAASLGSLHHMPGGGHGGAVPGINSGKGFCFVDHLGNLCPSGFLPLPVGNVRETKIASLYRDSALMRRLRDSSQLKGGCGLCPWRELCGGSRARAYAVTGDAFAAEPCCPLARQLEAGEIPPAVAAARATAAQPDASLEAEVAPTGTPVGRPNLPLVGIGSAGRS